MAVLLQIIQTLYWAGLSAWFGGALFLLLAMPVLVRTHREHDPTLPRVLSVNLDRQHADLLSLSLFERIAPLLWSIAAVASMLIALGLVAQIVQTALTGSALIFWIVRSVLFGVAVIAAAYDRFHLARVAARAFQLYINHADDPEQAIGHRDSLNRTHQTRVALLFLQTVLLLGVILFGPTGNAGTRFVFD
jgi:hypothetical protein